MKKQKTQAEIAAEIGVSQSTVSREYRRNALPKGGYDDARAQRMADERRSKGAPRSESKAGLLADAGADAVAIEGDGFRRRFLQAHPQGATKVLELIGASTLRESLLVTSTHGIVCHTGLLGNVFTLNHFDPIKEIPSGVYLTGFYSNTPTQEQIDAMMRLIQSAGIRPIIAARFPLADMDQAHTLAETRHTLGKIVVTV